MVEGCIVHRSSSCEKGKVFQKTLPRIVERVLSTGSLHKVGDHNDLSQ